MERGEIDVGHFLFAENEALIGGDAVGLRAVSSGYGVRGCAAPRQRKTQSRHCCHGGGLGCVALLCSLIYP
jgi:hypothetical protein